MDPLRFDHLTRSLFATRSRRRALLAGLVGAGSLLGVTERGVRGNKKKKKKKKKDENPCRPPNSERCGPGCTDPVSRPCCNGVPCATGQHCCFGQYCCPGGSGCDAGPERCCAPGRTCGVTCCDDVDTPCDTRFTPAECCPSNRICGAHCCLPGEGCDESTGTPTCCPFARTCGSECCAPGVVCNRDLVPPQCCSVPCPGSENGCCGEGETCCGTGATRTCCGTDRICHPGAGEVLPACCLPGRVPCGGGCCGPDPGGECCQTTGNPSFYYCCAPGLTCKPSGGPTCVRA